MAERICRESICLVRGKVSTRSRRGAASELPAYLGADFRRLKVDEVVWGCGER